MVGGHRLSPLPAVALLLLLSCAPAGYRELSGVLVDVRSREITHADSITLRDDAGSLHAFSVSPDVANHPEHPSTASHLRQHMTGGDRMVVRYRETGDGPVAIEVFHRG